MLNELGTLGLVQSDFQLSFWYKYAEKAMWREHRRARGSVGGRFASVYKFADTICAPSFVDTICASKPRPAALRHIILEIYKPCEWVALLNNYLLNNYMPRAGSAGATGGRGTAPRINIITMIEILKK